jgi:E3 ubiquitin-protein ligase MYCBP2
MILYVTGYIDDKYGFLNFRWLQPDSYVDPKQCSIQYNEEDLKCSWPNIITVLTKDQYNQQVYAPNLKVSI